MVYALGIDTKTCCESLISMFFVTICTESGLYCDCCLTSTYTCILLKAIVEFIEPACDILYSCWFLFLWLSKSCNAISEVYLYSCHIPCIQGCRYVVWNWTILPPGGGGGGWVLLILYGGGGGGATGPKISWGILRVKSRIWREYWENFPQIFFRRFCHIKVQIHTLYTNYVFSYCWK